MTQADQIQAARVKLERAIDRLVVAGSLRLDTPTDALEKRAWRRYHNAQRAMGRAIANYTRTVRKLKKSGTR